MSRFEAAPHPLLRSHVRAYWGFVRDFGTTREFAITPDCFVELLFFDEPPLAQTARGLRQLPACMLLPLLDEPLRILMNGTVRCAGVRLHAWSAGLLFPRVESAPHRWHDAGPAFGALQPAVAAALRRNAWSEIASLLDAALLRALAGAPDVTAGRRGRSRRQIERRVRSLTNRSPKQLASLMRFQVVRDALWAHPETALATLAVETGYADQAHLSRSFRRYAAQSPRQFARESAQLRAAFRAEDVAFVQDAARVR